MPARIFPEEGIDEDVTHDEHREDDADTVFRSEEFRDDEHIENRQPRKSRFGNAQTERSQTGQRKVCVGGIERQVHYL